MRYKHGNTTHYYNDGRTNPKLVLFMLSSQYLRHHHSENLGPISTCPSSIHHSLTWGPRAQCTNTGERSRTLAVLSFFRPHREPLSVIAICTRLSLPLLIPLWIHVFACGATVSIFRLLIIFTFHSLSLLLLSFQNSAPGVASFMGFPELPVIFWGPAFSVLSNTG